MGDSTREHQGQRLPIKVILPNQGKERPVPGGGAPPKPFRPVTPEYRARLGVQVSAIQRVMTPSVSTRVGSIPLRVRVTEHFKGLVPPEHKNPGQLYESYQVRELRKWAPVRTYFGDLNPGGERGLRWRLKLQLLSRHGVEKNQTTIRPQPFSLIITIADPERKALVYDEMAQVIRNRFQADNLVVRSGVHIRVRSY